MGLQHTAPPLPPHLQLGVAALDAGHRALYARLRALAGLDGSTFDSAWRSLADAMEQDFREEESLMESAAYALLPVHREQHARVLSALHHARAALDQGGRKSARRLLELLPEWLEVHIGTLDASLAAHCTQTVA